MSKPLTEKQKQMIRKNYRKKTVAKLAKELKADRQEIKAFIKSFDKKLSPVKRTVFIGILILIPILFFLLFELMFRLFHYGGNLNLFIPTPEDVGAYYMCNRDVGKRYFFMQFTIPNPSKDLFLREKPENGYRIFVLGGSTAAGFPYANNLTFSRILCHLLQDAYPEKHIEVVNLGMAAICSYTLLDFMDEVLNQNPDAILIYAGHNEFYGALGVASIEFLGQNPRVVRTYLKLSQFRTFLFIRNIIGQIKKRFSKIKYNQDEVEPTATLMERIVSEQTIPLGSPLYQKGMNQFQQNLDAILKKASKAGVKVMVSELVSNLRDQKPFISVSEKDRPMAKDIYQQAKALEQDKKYDESRIRFTQAKDLDALRFRATEECNTAIHQLAEKWQIPVVPMKHFFEDASEHGLVSNKLMVDHLHPNMDGYFLMANAFFETMKENRFIHAPLDLANLKPLAWYKKQWGITQLDTVYSNLSVDYLKSGWPFKPKGTTNQFLETFHPVTKIDSVALRVLLREETSLEDGHLLLAEYYEKRNQYEKALREYRALYYTIPFETMFYNRAADILIKQKRFTDAHSLLKKSNQVNVNLFATKWIGQVLFAQGEFNDAVLFLEKAYQMDQTNEQILYNLGCSCITTVKLKRVKEIIEVMKEKFPGSVNITKLEKMLYVATKASAAEMQRIIRQAQQHFQKEEYEKALTLFERTLKIQETGYAYTWMARIYLIKKDIPKGITYLEKALVLSPTDEAVLYNLANCYLLNEDMDNAKSTLKKLEKVNPNFKDPANLKGMLTSKNK